MPHEAVVRTAISHFVQHHRGDEQADAGHETMPPKRSSRSGSRRSPQELGS
jgi:hypothetical protein